MPPFAPKHIRELVPMLWRKSREVTQKMRQEAGPSGEAVFEVGDWAARAGLDIIGELEMMDYRAYRIWLIYQRTCGNGQRLWCHPRSRCTAGKGLR